MKKYLSLVLVAVLLFPIILAGMILYILGSPIILMDPRGDTIFHKFNWYGSGIISIALYSLLSSYNSLFGKTMK